MTAFDRVAYHPQDEPMSVEDMESYFDVTELGQIAGENPIPFPSTGDTREDRKKETKVFGQTFRGKPTFNLMPLAGENRAMVNPSAEIFRRSEEMNPFDQAWVVLKGDNFFDNMRAKKKRGEKTAKPGHEDYPDSKAWKEITEKAEKPFHGYNPNKHSRKGGLNAKGRAKAKREQGSNLKPPVTTKPSKLKPGGKKAKRRKSFCARMTGVKGPTSKEGKLTPKGASLKRWNC